MMRWRGKPTPAQRYPAVWAGGLLVACAAPLFVSLPDIFHLLIAIAKGDLYPGPREGAFLALFASTAFGLGTYLYLRRGNAARFSRLQLAGLLPALLLAIFLLQVGFAYVGWVPLLQFLQTTLYALATVFVWLIIGYRSIVRELGVDVCRTIRERLLRPDPLAAATAPAARDAAPFWFRPALFVLLAGLLAVTLRGAFVRAFTVDELEAVHSAWYVAQGWVPYRDFFQHHHPLLYYGLAPLIAFMGESTDVLFAGRLGMLAFQFGGLFVVAAMAGQVAGRNAGWVAAILLAASVFYTIPATEIRPDTPCTFFVVLAAFFILRHGRSARLWNVFAGGLSLGVAFLFLQKAVFPGLLIGLWILREAVGKRISWRGVGLFVAGGLLPVLLFAVWLGALDLWQTYWTLNWRLNMETIRQFPVWWYMLPSWRDNAFLWIAFAWALLARPVPGLRFVAWIGLGLILSLFLVRTPYRQYFMPIFPFMTVAVAVLLTRRVRLTGWLGFGLFALVCLLPLTGMWREQSPDNRAQLVRLAFVRDAVAADETVLDGTARQNLFRFDADYFWFHTVPRDGLLLVYRKLSDYRFSHAAIIARRKPRLIVTHHLDAELLPRLADCYAPAAAYDFLLLRKPSCDE